MSRVGLDRRTRLARARTLSLAGATAVEVAPNNDLWVLEQGGGVKRFHAGSTTADSAWLTVTTPRRIGL
jgi:hypothetical protein